MKQSSHHPTTRIGDVAREAVELFDAIHSLDRDKLARSIRIALQKRPIEPERIDQMISGIVRRLESMGETDIPSKRIGEIVMEALAGRTAPLQHVEAALACMIAAMGITYGFSRYELRVGRERICIAPIAATRIRG